MSDCIKVIRYLRKLPSIGSNQSSIYKSFLSDLRTKEDEKSKALKLATLHSYAVLVSNQTELTFLRSIDTGEKLDQKEKIRQTGELLNIDYLFISTLI